MLAKKYSFPYFFFNSCFYSYFCIGLKYIEQRLLLCPPRKIENRDGLKSNRTKKKYFSSKTRSKLFSTQQISFG